MSLPPEIKETRDVVVFMLLGGWYAEDVSHEPGARRRSQDGSGVTRDKRCPNLYSYSLLGLADERAFLNLPRRAI
jgi:hypothetical protein